MKINWIWGITINVIDSSWLIKIKNASTSLVCPKLLLGEPPVTILSYLSQCTSFSHYGLGTIPMTHMIRLLQDMGTHGSGPIRVGNSPTEVGSGPIRVSSGKVDSSGATKVGSAPTETVYLSLQFEVRK